MVDRPRCLGLLDAGRDAALTLVSASAGWGKTTLLAEWTRARSDHEPVAWLTLGAEDDDPRQLLAGIAASAGRAVPELASLDAPPRGPVDDFLGSLLAALTAAGGLTLVLDEAEHLRSPDALSVIDRLTGFGGATIRLVMATRFDPPMGLERRRLSGDLWEVRARDLAFDRAGVDRIVDAAGITLDGANRELLLERTEGWPAALGLAMMALRGHSDPDGFVQTFGGDDRAVSDYLTAEVLTGLDAASTELLVCTSIVDTISEDLAAAMLDDPAAGRPLGELAHSDGIVATADEHGRWFRYHPLLSAVLRAELRRRPRAEVTELHRRAAAWYAAADMTPDAIRHAVGARDWDMLADLLCDRWLHLTVRGEGARLRAVVADVPAEVADRDAEIGLALAGLLLDAGDTDGGRLLLRRARATAEDLAPARRRRFERTWAAFTLVSSSDLDHLERALADPDVEIEDEVRALGLTRLGREALWGGRLDLAARSLEEAAGLARECGNDFALVGAHGYLAGVYQLLGGTREARVLTGEAIALAVARGWAENPQVAMAHLCEAMELVATNQPEAATRPLDRARAVAGPGDAQLRLGIATCRAGILALTGDPLAALEVIRAARASGPADGWQAQRAARFEATLLLQAGQVERARQALEEAEARQPPQTLAGAWARLALAEGSPRDAVGVLGDEWLEGLRQAEQRAEAFALRAMALEALGEPAAADEELTRALDAAEPAGYRSMFSLLGGLMSDLLRRHARHGGPHAAFAQEVADANRHPENGREPGYALLEPLSERELAVLRFLPTMLSNAEIASELFVSVNTVKTHLRHIYRKLDVTDRRQAVRRGRQLHLLNPGLGGR